MNDQLSMRLAMLKQEFANGQMRIQELEQQELTLREALLRLSGAIEVLEEIMGGQLPMGAAEPRSADAIPKPLARLPG